MATRKLLAVLLLLVSTAFAEEVVQFRADAQHSGVYRTAEPNGSAYVKWRFRTGNKVRSTPAVYKGLVIFGSNDGFVYAVDEASGKQIWTFHTGGIVSSSPAIANGVVYIQSADQHVYALDAQTGKQRWNFAVGADLPFRNGVAPADIGPPDYGLWDFYLSSPVVSGDKLYIGAGDGKLYALEARTGKQVWSFATKGRVRSTAAVDAGTVYFGSMDGNLYALDATTGAQKWKFKTLGSEYFPVGEVQSSPAVADGFVVFGSRDGNLYAVDAATGDMRWKISHEGSWVIGSPAVAAGILYVGSSDARFVQAVEVKTGTEKWREKVNGNVFASAALVGNLVVFTDWEGVMMLRDAKTGKPVAGAITEDRINGSPVVHEGVVFFGADDDYLYAVGTRKAASGPK